MDNSSKHEIVYNYIYENLVIFDDEIKFNNDDNIFKLGFVNSLFAMKLLRFVEKEYKFQINPQDLNIKNFSSVNNIVQLIDKYTV